MTNTQHQQVKILYTEFENGIPNYCHVTFSYMGEQTEDAFVRNCKEFVAKWKGGKAGEKKKNKEAKSEVQGRLSNIMLNGMQGRWPKEEKKDGEVNWSGMSQDHLTEFLRYVYGNPNVSISSVPLLFHSPCRHFHSVWETENKGIGSVFVTVCRRFHTNGKKMLRNMKRIHRSVKRNINMHEPYGREDEGPNSSKDASKTVDIDVWYRIRPEKTFAHIGKLSMNLEKWLYPNGAVFIESSSLLDSEEVIDFLKSKSLIYNYTKYGAYYDNSSWYEDNSKALWGGSRLLKSLSNTKQVMFVPKVVSYVDIFAIDESGIEKKEGWDRVYVKDNRGNQEYSRIHTEIWNSPPWMKVWVYNFFRLKNAYRLDVFTDLTVEEKKCEYIITDDANHQKLIFLEKDAHSYKKKWQPADFKCFQVKFFVGGESKTELYAVCLQDAEFPIDNSDTQGSDERIPNKTIQLLEKRVFTTPLTWSPSRAVADPFQDKHGPLPPRDAFFDIGSKF